MNNSVSNRQIIAKLVLSNENKTGWITQVQGQCFFLHKCVPYVSNLIAT